MCSRTYRVQRNGVGFQTVAVIGGSSGHPGSVAPDPKRTEAPMGCLFPAPYLFS
jgi:hypothetical protein